MKKLTALLLICMLLLPCIALAAPQTIDLDTMSFDELVALRAQIDKAVTKCQDWQEVDVPQGIYQIGVDIPAGHWTLMAKGNYCSVTYGDKLEDGKNKVDTWNSTVRLFESFTNPKSKYYDENDDKAQIDIDMQDGFYIEIDNGTCVFTPYVGKPSLGFK